MSNGGAQYGAQSYGGTRVVPAASGGVITDPANPGGSGWSFQNQGSGGPYGGIAYGGGGLLTQPGTGGISATADPLVAAVRITAWWSRAAYLRVTRLVNGAREPVRGAYPVTVGSPSRFNRVTNPSAEVDTAGWLAGANTTLSRIQPTGGTLAGTSAFRLRATAAGAVNATVPAALPIPEGPPNVSFALMLSAAPTGALTVSVAWRDAANTVLATTTATLAAGSLTPFVGRWDRTPVLSVPLPATLPPGSAGIASGVLTVQVAGMAANGTADLDAVLVEGGSTSGDYFDGRTQYASWLGTPDASVSVLAPVTTVVDNEAPFDIPIRYELTAPDQPTVRIISEPVILASEDRTWLSSPTTGAALVVTVAEEPEQTRAIARGVFPVLGKSRPIAVSASRRQAPAGTLEVWAMTFAERDALLDMLEDGSPLLLRAPANLGHGPGEWISIGDVTVTRPGHGAWEALRALTLPYHVVDPPVANPDGEVAA